MVYTLFAYRENHRSNAVNLSKNTVGINEPEISDALKYYKSHKNDAKSLRLYSVKTKFDQSLHQSRKKSLHKVYIVRIE